MSVPRITVVIVDDHAIVRQGLRALLDVQASIDIVGEADGGEMALTLIRSLEPDVVLLDLLMPDMTGIDVLNALQGASSRVLVLTSSVEEAMVTEALRAGATGYLLKTTRSVDLVRAIQRAADGTPTLDPVATQAMIQLSRATQPLSSLTPREIDVFYLLARGLNAAETARLLVVSEATVRTHTASILDKLDLRDRVQLMAFALKQGLVHPEDLE